MNIIRKKLFGWKTKLAAVSTIAGVWVAYINETMTLEGAISATVVAILGLTLGAKIDRAVK
jgi:hypothetical protein